MKSWGAATNQELLMLVRVQYFLWSKVIKSSQGQEHKQILVRLAPARHHILVCFLSGKTFEDCVSSVNTARYTTTSYCTITIPHNSL